MGYVLTFLGGVGTGAVLVVVAWWLIVKMRVGFE